MLSVKNQTWGWGWEGPLQHPSLGYDRNIPLTKQNKTELNQKQTSELPEAPEEKNPSMTDRCLCMDTKEASF